MRSSPTCRKFAAPKRKFGAPSAPAALSRLVATTAARPSPGAPPRGLLRAGALTLPCALGAGGVRRAKREGDGASPAGSWRLLSGYFRADRLARVPTPLPMRATGARDGWCDDPSSALYNRPVSLPFAGSREEMRRDDGLYDLVVALDYNMAPRRKGRGSAIFLHCAREGFSPTRGCVALRREDLRRLLPRLSPRTTLVIL
ncbi:L,D-transpeptidase [Methylocella sp.]|uniref:L,D-transpeptidase family protein n=1 Tax=Methylocella sp. TaxID=1978226 RepID=UPI0035B03BCC